MKRTVSVIVALVMLSMCMVSCSQSTAPDGYQQVSGDDVAYLFYAPTTWSINSAGAVNSAYFSIDDPAMVMVTFYAPDSEQADIDSFWTYVEEQYKTSYQNYALVESGMATLGTRNAAKYVFTATIGGDDYKVMQLITGYGNHYYAMTYMASPETFDSHLEEVEAMAGHFSFK